MLFSTLSLSNRGSQTRIIDARSRLFEQISKLKQYNRMNQVKEVVDLLTKKDEQLKAVYQEELQRANDELEMHLKKVEYYTAFIKQREQFVDQIDNKLRKIDRREERLIKALSDK